MRLTFLKFLYLLSLGAIIIRLGYWQIIKSDELKALAEDQHLSIHKIAAPRGEIFAADHSLLVSNRPSYSVYALPKLIQSQKINKTLIAERLAQVFNEKSDKADEDRVSTKDEIIEKLNKDLFWIMLKKDVDISTKNKIEKLNLNGIGFEDNLSRFYPEASSAAHVLGFVAEDSFGKQSGYFGIEGFYNRELRGVEGKLVEEKDARGLPILTGTFLKKEPAHGFNLVLNIDKTVQLIVEQSLKQGLEKYGAKSASAVVIDPKTGSILAMASFPNYDPSHYKDFPKDYFKNPIVADSYEPGSTFKTIIMAAGINEGVVEPDSRCNECEGPVSVGGFLIRTWNNKYYPNTTIRDTMIHSDNTGMVFVGKKLGIVKTFEYLKRFGFDSPTKIDLQDERVSELRPKKDWKEVDLATVSFGQGIAVTAMQMIRGVAAIANGGNLMEPHLIKAIEMPDKHIEIKPKIVEVPITGQTANVVTGMMVEAVERGEAKVFKPKGFKIAGKTGTAQIPVAGHYDPNKTIASFVGFAPANEPKFAMLVRYQEPSASIFGAETAAPTFFEISKELFTYYGIAPEE